MTINSLLKLIPEEKRDYFVLIDIPQVRPGDEGEFPLIEVTIDDINERILLEADVQ